jgi:hypothetical protein
MKRILTLILILIATTAVAQTDTAKSAAAPVTTTSGTTTTVVVNNDSEVVRQQFRELLERHPPQVGRVLKLDPTLFNNEAWLANYPALAAYLKEHPEVAHSPAYYLENVYIPGDSRPDTASERVWRELMEGISIFLVVGSIIAVLTWLIKTLIEHRRWSRLSKVQADVHNKILDRFGSNEEMLAYIQTPAGKRFLESAPLQLDATPRPTSAPVNRILWSVQVGLVIAAVGVGFLIVKNNVQQDVVQPLFALGILAISLGVGFVVSSIVSYLLSRQLGLWDEQPSRPASEQDV